MSELAPGALEPDEADDQVDAADGSVVPLHRGD